MRISLIWIICEEKQKLFLLKSRKVNRKERLNSLSFLLKEDEMIYM